MNVIRARYSGELLVTHLTAYGLIAVLDSARITAWLHHDPDSLSYEPVIEFEAEHADAAAAIRRSANDLEELVEADIVPGKTGNDRRPLVWARASFANDPSRAADVLALREALAGSDQYADHPLAQRLLTGLGASAAWGDAKLKPSHGATALDGVIGNNTSDFVRGVLRPARVAAARVVEDFTQSLPLEPADQQPDKTGWAPPGTNIDLADQWLAALGLSLLPVAHHPTSRSSTPGHWRVNGSEGVVLPLIARPASHLRARAILGLDALTTVASVKASNPTTVPPHLAAASDRLRSLGVDELAMFGRRNKPGDSSVAFSFDRGVRIPLR